MKEYIKPTINIQQVVVEQLLASGSNKVEGGQVEETAKRNDFWADEDEASTSEDWN